MPNRLVLRVLLLVMSHAVAAFSAPANDVSPMAPCDIVVALAQIKIPVIQYRDPASLGEVLSFIQSRYDNLDVEPARKSSFVFDLQLPEETLKRQITLEGRGITMIEAIKLALRDVPYALTFDPGKVVFRPPSTAPTGSGH